MAVTTTRTRTLGDPRPGQANRAQLRQIPIAGTRPRPSASAAAVVTAYLKTQAARLGELEPKVRADAQVPGGLAGQHRVVVVAERRLDPLHLLGEPAGLLADRGGRGPLPRPER